MAAEARHGGSQNCLRQGLSTLGAHILVPVARRLEMALPGQLMLEGSVGAERETLPHPHPVCQDAYYDEGGGRRGFLPVVPLLPSLPGCKIVAPLPAIPEPSLHFQSFCMATSSLAPSALHPVPTMVFPEQSSLPH